MIEFIARRVAPPAPLADGEFMVSATANATGGFAVLATTEPAVARGFVDGPHGNRLPFYVPPRSCPAVLLVFEAGQWRRVDLAFLPVSYPCIALLPDGEVLVVSLCKPWTGQGWERRNAHVFGPDGAHRRAFALGDQLEQVVVDDDGTIWTAHGDEGWSDDDVDFSGLIRWDGNGRRLWGSGVACCDAAVNASDGLAWAFRWRATLIRVREGVTQEFDSPVDGVHAIVVDGDRLLVAGAVEPGGPGDELSWCALVGGVIQRSEAAGIVDVDGQPIREWAVLACHGSRLYLHDDGDGYRCVDIGADVSGAR
ncbi:hypothetical protein [Virgisporangium aurantiacum]|nr:hypothetical protein [Virgisporangium aurantiacum]